MGKTGGDFMLKSRADVPHKERVIRILHEHAEIRRLIGNNPYTFLFICGIVAFQIVVAALVQNAPWWALFLTAYCIGAFANHCLYVLIHECGHNLVFKKKTPNLWAGIIADLPNVIPAAISFRRYHTKHHAFLGVYELDADLPHRWEARLVGTSPVRKAIWLFLFPLVQALRPPRITSVRFADRWTLANIGVVFAFDVLILIFVGPKALIYMMLSTLFALGLHPLGARWIQEHYVVAPPQETYSYYGPLNYLCFNMGYHNEHHDFPSIPWNRLPQVRAMAPEWYDSLHFHTSWTRLLFKFIKEADLNLFSRVERVHEMAGQRRS